MRLGCRVAAPAAMVIHGASSAYTFTYRLWTISAEQAGTEWLLAVAWAAGWCCCALRLHLHFVWGRIERSREWAGLAERVVTAFIVVCVAAFAYATLGGM